MGGLNENAVLQGSDLQNSSLQDPSLQNPKDRVLVQSCEDRYVIDGAYQPIKNTLKEVCDQIDNILHIDQGTAWSSIGCAMNGRKKNTYDTQNRIWEMVADGNSGIRIRKLSTTRHRDSQNLVFPVVMEKVRVSEKGPDGKAVSPLKMIDSFSVRIVTGNRRTGMQF